MQYLIGFIAGGLIIGIWVFNRCRHCRDLVELKRSEFKTGLNCLNRLEAAINRIGNINEARLKVEAEAAGVDLEDHA